MSVFAIRPRCRRSFFAGLVALAGCLSGQALAFQLNYEQKWTNFEESFDVRPWEEVAVQLPPPPKAENLREIYVSAIAQHRFFIDRPSVSVGTDGVVRYALVTLTSTGLRNTSYEGMRCETRERRGYAFAAPDGTWMKSRNDRWFLVEENNLSRHYAALYLEYFCSDRIVQALPVILKRLDSSMDLHNIRRD